MRFYLKAGGSKTVKGLSRDAKLQAILKKYDVSQIGNYRISERASFGLSRQFSRWRKRDLRRHRERRTYRNSQ